MDQSFLKETNEAIAGIISGSKNLSEGSADSEAQGLPVALSEASSPEEPFKLAVENLKSKLNSVEREASSISKEMKKLKSFLSKSGDKSAKIDAGKLEAELMVLFRDTRKVSISLDRVIDIWRVIRNEYL